MFCSPAPIRMVLVIAIALWASACTLKTNSGGGVVDGGGGGELRLHSREEAVREIQKAWNLLVATRPDNPLIVAAGFLQWRDYAARASWNRGEPLTPQEVQIEGMIKKMLGRGGSSTRGFGRYEETDFSKNLKDKKLKLIESGPCKGPSHSGHVASVSRLDFSGELCVSIREVQKMPFSGVTSTPLIALLVHEIAHLHGYDEPSARLIQDYFLRHMATIMGFREEESKRNISARAEHKIRGIRETLYMHTLDAHYIRRLNRLAGEMREIRESLPAPYSIDSLPDHSPDKYEKLYREIDAISDGYAALADDLTSKMRRIRNRPVPKDAAIAARVRDLGLRSVRFLDSLKVYLFGSKRPYELAEHELDTESFPLGEEEIISKTGG